MQKRERIGSGRYNMIERPTTNLFEILFEHDKLVTAIERRLEKHGKGIAVSPHEIHGIISEEMYELTKELHMNDYREFYKELVDIAVAAIFGMVSMKHYMLNKGMDFNDKELV